MLHKKWSLFSFAIFLMVALLLLGACSGEDKDDEKEEQPPAPTETTAPADTGSDVITLHYHERVPYMETTDTGVSGLTATPATIAFEQSGVAFQWALTPTNRQLEIAQANTGRDCFLGWFKNPDRELFARFTLPLYQDRPMAALALATNENVGSGRTVEESLTDATITLLVKDGYSYGTFLDGKIAEYNPIRETTTVENIDMLEMLHAERADYFFIAPEEAEALIAASTFPAEDFKLIEFSDMPPGNYRYIMCSFQVEEAEIEQLNAAIAANVTLE
jgi:hypothetical protein